MENKRGDLLISYNVPQCDILYTYVLNCKRRAKIKWLEERQL
jgi:hypothetical protein